MTWVACWAMRRTLARSVFAIGLILSRVVVVDVVHMSEAHAATQPGGVSTIMTVMPCHDGMLASAPADQPQSSKHHAPPHGGTCCKPSQCLCLNTPALATRLPIPVMSLVSFTTVASPALQRATEPETAFFRPPI